MNYSASEFFLFIIFFIFIINKIGYRNNRIENYLNKNKET